MENKPFQELIGKYLVINDQKPGFKIEKIVEAFDKHNSILLCEHNLNLCVSNSNIRLMSGDNYYTVINNNCFSIEDAPEEESNVEIENTNEHPVYKYKENKTIRNRIWNQYKENINYFKRYTTMKGATLNKDGLEQCFQNAVNEVEFFEKCINKKEN